MVSAVGLGLGAAALSALGIGGSVAAAPYLYRRGEATAGSIFGLRTSDEMQALLNAIRGHSDVTAPAATTTHSALRAHRIDQIPRRVLTAIRDQISNTLDLPVGEGHPLTTPISEEDRERLTALRDAINELPAGAADETIDFSAQRDVFSQGLQSAVRVIENNSPRLAQTIDTLRSILENAQRTATPECRNVHTILSNLLRTTADPTDSQRQELFDNLQYLINHPITLDGSGVSVDNITELFNILREGHPFDRAIAQRVLGDAERIIHTQSGEIERILLQVRNSIFDPNSGMLRNVLDATLGQGGIADQLVSDAPPSLTALNDSLSQLLNHPLQRSALSRAFFDTLRFTFGADQPTYLGRPLTDEERGNIQVAYLKLGHVVFANRPKRREYEAMLETFASIRDNAAGINTDFLQKIHEFLALDPIYSQTTGVDQHIDIPSEHQRKLRVLAQYVLREHIRTPDNLLLSNAVSALEQITISEETIRLDRETRAHATRLGEQIHTFMTERAGRVYTMFHDLKRELIHPERGLLPGIMRDYFQEVGRDAIKTMHSLESLTTQRQSLETFRIALQRTRDFARRFEMIMNREPSESEQRDFNTLITTLDQVIRSGEYDTFSSSDRFEPFLQAKGRIAAAVDAGQGQVQRQIFGMVSQVEGMIEGVLGQVNRFTRAVPSDHPLIQLQSALTRFTATIQGGSRTHFETDKTLLQQSIASILQLEDIEIVRVFGRPIDECRPTLRQLNILNQTIAQIDSFPEGETKQPLETFLQRETSFIRQAVQSHPEYGELHRAVDGMTDVAMQRIDDAAAILQRRLGGIMGGFGGAAAAPEGGADTPRPPSHTNHPVFLCMQNAIRLFDDTSMQSPRRNERLQEEINRLDPAIKDRMLTLIGERQGHNATWAGRHLHEDRTIFLTALAQTLTEKVDRSALQVRRAYYLSIYEGAPAKPDCTTDDQKITWAQQNVLQSHVKAITAYAQVQTNEAPRAAASPHPQQQASQASQRTGGESSSPDTSGSAGIGAVCGGLFSGALHFIQNAPQVMATFSLDSFAGFIQHHLDTSIIDFVRQFRDIDPAQRTSIISAVQAGARRLEEARVAGSLEGYQTALSEVARNLSRYDILINGTAMVPSFGETYRADRMREEEERRIAEAERLLPNQQNDARNPAERVNHAKEEFKDLLGMYTTFMSIFGTRDGEETRTQAILDQIEREIEADVTFPYRNQKDSSEYRAEFDRRRAEKIGEFADAEKDPTLENVMRAVSVATPNERKKVFKRELHRRIDERFPNSWVKRTRLKWLTIPLLMTFIPFFVGKTIDNFLWKLRVLIHKTTQREEGNQVTVLDIKVIDRITSFFAKYRKAIDHWAENGGESRNEAIDAFMHERRNNNGLEENQVRDMLGDLLIDNFYVDTSLIDGPAKQASDWFNYGYTWPTTALQSVLWLPKAFLGTFIGTAYSAWYLICLIGQSGWNGLSRFAMKQVLSNTALIKQLGDTASTSLYSKAYVNTLNTLLVRQLREAWKLLRETEKDAATEKGLQLVPRIVDNTAAPRKEALTHLEHAWMYLKTKLPEDDPRIRACDTQLRQLQTNMGEDGAPQNISVRRYNTNLKEFGRTLWRIHDTFRTESLADKYPDRTKQAVSELIQHVIVVLDKRSQLDPDRAREGGITDTIRNNVRAMFLDQAVDSIASLLLVACETFLQKDFLESQLATALEASNDTMYYRNPENDDVSSLQSHQIEQLVSNYTDMIIRSVVNSNVDGVVGSLRDGKIQRAKETIDWLKITFSDGTGLRCKSPTPRKNLTEEWTTKLNEYAANGDVDKINEMQIALHQVLTETLNKGSELHLSREMSEQMRRHLGEARDRVVATLHRMQDALTPLLHRARSIRISRDVETHTRSMSDALIRARDQMNGFTQDTLGAISTQMLEQLRSHASATTAAIQHLENPDPQLEIRIRRAVGQTAAIERFATRITTHQSQVQQLVHLRNLCESYATNRRQGIIQERQAEGPAAVAAPVAGGNAAANRIRIEIDAALEAIGRTVPFDRASLAATYQRLLSANTTDDVATIGGTLTAQINRAIDAEKTHVLQERDQLAQSLNETSQSLLEYNASLQEQRGGENPLPVEQLVGQIRGAITDVRRTVNEITYPPLLNIDLVDLSPGSMASEWIKGFVYKELEKRTKQAVRLTQDGVTFKSAIHHAAVSLVRELGDQEAMRRMDLENRGG